MAANVGVSILQNVVTARIGLVVLSSHVDSDIALLGQAKRANGEAFGHLVIRRSPENPSEIWIFRKAMLPQLAEEPEVSDGPPRGLSLSSLGLD